jgi:putative addiction module component (TIGR02574 family)
MTQAVERILFQIGQLSAEEQAEVADALFASMEPVPDTTDAFEAELARRVDEIRSGKAVGKPAAQLFAELRRSKP